MPRRRKSVPQLKRRRLPSASGSTLYPPPADRARLDDLLTRELMRANERVAEGPVTPDQNLAGFRSELAAFDFSLPPPPADDLLPWTIEQMERGVVHVDPSTVLWVVQSRANGAGTVGGSHRRRPSIRSWPPGRPLRPRSRSRPTWDPSGCPARQTSG